jgi:diguanylate cyclase (GGDEF)-like protein
VAPMTERVRLGAEARLRAIIEVQASVTDADLDSDEIMRRVVARTAELTSASAVTVEMAEGSEMVNRAATGTAAGTVGRRLDRATSFSGACVQSGEVLRCDDTELDPRADRAGMRPIDARSMLAVPLVYRGATIGVLEVMSPSPSWFDDDDVDTLRVMAGFIASSIRNATAYEREVHHAQHDALTGLPNRKSMLEHLEHALTRRSQGRCQAALLFVDLDEFKPVNDRLGHAAGDRALVVVADRLRRAVRPSDVVARLGGDEFVILLEDIRAADVPTVIERVEHALAEPMDIGHAVVTVGASIGVALSRPGMSPDQLLRAADRDMYRVTPRRQVSGA